MYYDNDNNRVLVYPHEIYRKYYLNEFPTYLNGTYAVMIREAKDEKKKSRFINSKVSSDSLLTIEKTFLLMGDEKSNYYLRQRFIGVDLNSDLSSYWSILNYSGLFSTDSRPFYSNMLNSNEKYMSYINEIQKGRDLFKIDSIYLRNENKKPPYNYSIGMNGKLGKFFNFINDTTIVISLNEILNNSKIEYNSPSRNLDIFLPYAYSDIQDLIIDFKQPIEIINLEILQKNKENSLGSYKFETIPLEKNKLHLTSTYIIRKELIEKTSFKNLDEINEASNQISNSKLIHRIKK
jgi:hypothetical protein